MIFRPIENIAWRVASPKDSSGYWITPPTFVLKFQDQICPSCLQTQSWQFIACSACLLTPLFMPEITTIHEYDLDRNGVRFPSKTTFIEKYKPAGSPAFERSRTDFAGREVLLESSTDSPELLVTSSHGRELERSFFGRVSLSSAERQPLPSSSSSCVTTEKRGNASSS